MMMMILKSTTVWNNYLTGLADCHSDPDVKQERQKYTQAQNLSSFSKQCTDVQALTNTSI